MEGIYSMSKKIINKAPSTSGTDKSIGDDSRTKNNKENKTMSQFINVFWGLIYLGIKASFLVAAITMMNMPSVHFIWDIPLHQIIGGVIIAHLIYVELHNYVTTTANGKKSKKSALEKFKLGFEDLK